MGRKGPPPVGPFRPSPLADSYCVPTTCTFQTQSSTVSKTKSLPVGPQVNMCVCSCLVVTSNSSRPHGLQHPGFPSFTFSRSLPKFMSVESMMPSNHVIICQPLLRLPSVFGSIRVFANESALHIRYWSFSISPSNDYSGLISSKINWFDLLAVQGTLKGLLQLHSSKASILWHSAFFIVQLSHPYVTAGKTIALTIWTFVSKVMSLLSNTLSRFVIAFLPRSNRLHGK